MRQFVDCPIDGLLVTWHHPMKFFLQIACLIALGSTAFPQQNTREYLQHLVGRPLILRYYGDSVSPSAKEKDLSHKRGGCDEAVEVTGVTFAASSIRLQLRNIGGPSIGNNKSKTCHVSPDEYSLSVTEFDQDQSREQAENAIGYVLQTPEAYLAAYGITLNLPAASETSESPVESFLGPGFTPPKAVLAVHPQPEAKGNVRHKGAVTVSCVIGRDGLVHDPVIANGLTDDLNKSALDTLRFWRLEPARRGTDSVAAKIKLQFSFE
jgi:TonB family protein